MMSRTLLLRPSWRPLDSPRLIKRQFTAGAPNRLWVADFTYVSTWAGTVYTAFGIDVFSRRIVGWTCSMSKETDLVLDAIEMGLRERSYQWKEGEDRLASHSDPGRQYTSVPVTPTTTRSRKLP